MLCQPTPILLAGPDKHDHSARLRHAAQFSQARLSPLFRHSSKAGARERNMDTIVLLGQSREASGIYYKLIPPVRELLLHDAAPPRRRFDGINKSGPALQASKS